VGVADAKRASGRLHPERIKPIIAAQQVINILLKETDKKTFQFI
jgi:hypothetical protein